MIKSILYFALTMSLVFSSNNSTLKENLSIRIYTYEKDGITKASAMPELKSTSDFIGYKRRLDYLLINVSDIHKREKSKQRNKIFELYPDTTKLKRLYVKQYLRDKKLVKYFNEAVAAIKNPNLEISKKYSQDELMEVASKFFYCDKVKADSSVQAHVCVGLNGVEEANWENDYTFLEAFCYEAIFTDFDNGDSQIWESFVSKKEEASSHYKADISTLEQYLEDVKLDLFQRMKSDTILKKQLLDFYRHNESNLPFRIEP